MLTICRRIARPEDAHGVVSPDAYVRILHEHIVKQKRARPSVHLQWPEPHVADPIQPVIQQGRWLVPCPCGNFPSYDPEWQLAVCLDCAAIYKSAPPCDWREIEACLMRRPNAENRNMEHDETLADLRRENDEHGLGEGA